MHIHTDRYRQIVKYLHTHTVTCTKTYIYIYIHIFTYIQAHVAGGSNSPPMPCGRRERELCLLLVLLAGCLHRHACIHTLVYIYICVCTYLCTCIHTYNIPLCIHIYMIYIYMQVSNVPYMRAACFSHHCCLPQGHGVRSASTGCFVVQLGAEEGGCSCIGAVGV